VHNLATARVDRLRASGATDRGPVRPVNEDYFGIDPMLQLLVVADGMGGHNAGEVAARLAVDAVLDFVGNRVVTTTWPYGYDVGASPAVNLLRTAVQVANAQVLDAGASSARCSGMGTTLVAALVRGDVATVAHVGDSRAYVVAGRDVEQLTMDDSWAAAIMARDPSMKLDSLTEHPMRHALTSVVGTRAKVEVHVTERSLLANDVLLLTTDGVHGVLDQHDLARAREMAYNLDSLVAGLVHLALQRGSRDNCTAVAARFER
jgi:protein phosphatase